MKSIKIKEFIPSKFIPKVGNLKKLNVSENNNSWILNAKGRSKEIRLPKTVSLSNNDFIAIGLYLAEGSTYINSSKKYNHNGEVQFVNSYGLSLEIFCEFLEKLGIPRCHLSWKIELNVNFKKLNSERKLFNYWVNYLRLNPRLARPKWFRLNGQVNGKMSGSSSPQGCVNLYYSSTIFRAFLLNLINKIFDLSLKNRLKKELSLILKGFFAGDGSLNYCQKYNRKHVEFLTNDIELLNKIRSALAIIGLKNIRETYPETTKNHTKSLRIYNLHDFKILDKHNILNFVGYKYKKFQEILDSY